MPAKVVLIGPSMVPYRAEISVPIRNEAFQENSNKARRQLMRKRNIRIIRVSKNVRMRVFRFKAAGFLTAKGSLKTAPSSMPSTSSGNL